ncbi:MAG TPA: glycosyltransferase [Actinomycetota bacterium]
MLQVVDVETQPIRAYEPFIGAEGVEELVALGRELAGARVLHLNATAYGGGVSELLRSMIPIYRGLGIEAEWQVITGDEAFFEVTKCLHNALQGGKFPLGDRGRATYVEQSRRNAEALEGEWDFLIVHDPQPVAMRHFRPGDGGRWIWRCHIDTSNPNSAAVELLEPYVEEHDAIVFTLPQFAPEAWDNSVVRTMAPGIDPLSPKNMDLPPQVHDQIALWLGVDPHRPLMTQVSRFDSWKDPMGVVDVFRVVREEVPGLQLALLGSMALDDPEGWRLYDRIREEAVGDRDLHVATNITGVSNIEVNAFQRLSDVVIQKSIREGFGLVVSETLWKETPVVAGRAGGIPVQMPEGIGGVLATTDEEYAEGVLRMLREPELARDLAAKGREHVRRHFLITRLVADELRLLRDLG